MHIYDIERAEFAEAPLADEDRVGLDYVGWVPELGLLPVAPAGISVRHRPEEQAVLIEALLRRGF